MRLVLIVVLQMALAGCTAYMVGGGTGAGGATGNGERSSGVVTADASITDRVRAGLSADALTAGANIVVKTVDGIVFLSGAVADYRVRERADRVARGTSGVQGVNNRILIQESD